jgi:hypothetical protein
MLRRLWPGWRKALILVQPDTVVRWHIAGFRLYWKWLSRRRIGGGRRCVSRGLRELIFRMVVENKTWGAPRIHGELRMLGFDISERTALRWMRKAPRRPDPAKHRAASWLEQTNSGGPESDRSEHPRQGCLDAEAWWSASSIGSGSLSRQFVSESTYSSNE